MEETLIILKPDCLERELVEECIDRISKIGKIELIKYHKVKAREILKHYYNNLKNESEEIKCRVLDYFVNRNIILLIVSGEDIIKKIRSEIGASDPLKSKIGTIRGDFGDDSYEKADFECRSCNNIIHASDSKESYEYEKKIWI